MAFQNLEKRASEFYDNSVIECLRKDIHPIGSTLNIGEHVWDVVCEFDEKKYSDGSRVPVDGIFEISDNERKYYAKIDEKFLKNVSNFNEIEKVSLNFVSPEANAETIKAKVIRNEHGGSGGNAAIAQRAFLNYLIFRIGKKEFPDKKKVLSKLKGIKVLYSGIDSITNGFEQYYRDKGLVTRGEKNTLMILPKEYQVPMNFIFETGSKKILRSPQKHLDYNGIFQEPLSRTNMEGVGSIFLNSVKNEYLFQEALKLYKESRIIKGGAFTHSSFNSQEDLIENRLLNNLEVIAENREEIGYMAGKGLYGGLDSLAKKNNNSNLVIFTTLDKRGIMASYYQEGERSKEIVSNPLITPEENHKPEFTGAGDTALGVAMMGHILGLPAEYTIELANVFAQYRINTNGIHTYADELHGEIKNNKKNLSIEKCLIDPAR
ncbi:MAG: hypothetical protein ACOCUU_01790 [Nanoarchaeota archaeon]